MKKSFSLIFVLLITIPVLFYFVKFPWGNDPFSGPACLKPVPHKRVWLSPNFYDSVRQWLRCTFPLKQPLVALKNRIDYRLFSFTDSDNIHIGSNGWLFQKNTIIKSHDGNDDAKPLSKQLLNRLHAIEKVLAAAKIKFVFTIAPDKATIYPEHTRTRPEDDLLKNFLEQESKIPLGGFVRLDLLLKKEKLTQPDLYGKTDSRWNHYTAALSANEILKKADIEQTPIDVQSTRFPKDNGDLYQALMGKAQKHPAPSIRHFFGPKNSDGPSAIIYGDVYAASLIPILKKHFSKLDAVFSNRMPSKNFGENFAFADVIILECAQNRLKQLNIDLQHLYAGIEPFFENTFKRALPNAKIQPVSMLSIHLEKDALAIRSTGNKSLLTFSNVQGSTDSIFKFLKLSIEAGQSNTLTMWPEGRAGFTLRKKIRAGISSVVYPLPFSENVNITVNPGEHPGIFKLRSIQTIGFPGDKAKGPVEKFMPSEKNQDIYTGIEFVQKADGQSRTDPDKKGMAKQKDPALNMPTLWISDIEEGKIFQRKGQSADIAVTGSYTGYPGAIEARVINADPFEVVVPWTVIQGEPENNVFIGILKNVPQGGWYKIEVRSSIAPWIKSSGSNTWGVGMLIACIGQSNMKEWFNTGNHIKAHPLLRFHSNGSWVIPQKTGNGAMTLGNRLAADLGVPVGLMDYAVNGSGLTRAADFGKGFWMDNAPDGIYDSFVNSIQRAGGSLEFIIFMQGEADAARGFISAKQYRQALERFISDKIRQDIENRSELNNLPFLIIPMVKRPGGKDAPCQSIRNAQMKTIENVNNCYLGAIPIDLKNKGSQHLAPSQYKILGNRVAQTILYLLGKQDYHRGPFATSVTRVNGTTIDVTLKHRKGDDFTPTADITGFDVLSDKKMLPVKEVVRKDATTIRIKLDAFFIGPFTVRYLYGAMPDTSSPVRDNSPLSLPLEPFIMH